MHTSQFPTHITQKYSMTEMRYVDFDYLLAGMIKTSASLRQELTKRNPSIFYTKTKATTNSLASLLVKTKN